jgi:cytochrome b
VMGLALLASMAATTATGMAVLAQSHDAGPLAPWFGKSAAQAGLSGIAPAYADSDDDDRHGARGSGEGHEGGESAMEDVHEFFANLTLVLILLHVTGVALASLSHRENLVRSMITGTKPADEA